MSRRSGLALISSIVPDCRGRLDDCREVELRTAAGARSCVPDRWPMTSTSGLEIARTIRAVIAAASIWNEECTDATTQSSAASVSSS